MTSIFRITRGKTFSKTLNELQKLINKCVHILDAIALPAGTTTVAPLTFTSGPLLTSPLAGSMEFLDGTLFFTGVDGIRYALTLNTGLKTATTTVTNTTVETVIFTRVFSANELFAGNLAEIVAIGSYTNASASDDFTLRLKLDGVTIATIERNAGNETDAGWEATAKLTIRTDGASGTYVKFFKYIENNNVVLAEADITEESIDTTASHTFTITVQWSNAKAGNLFSCTQGYVEFKH